MAMDRKDVENSPSSRGKTLYLKYLDGERLSPSQAILSGCFCCMNGFQDGRNSCEIPECPLFPWMPYNRQERQKARKGKKLSEEHKKKLLAGKKKRVKK